MGLVEARDVLTELFGGFIEVRNVLTKPSVGCNSYRYTHRTVWGCRRSGAGTQAGTLTEAASSLQAEFRNAEEKCWAL